MGDILTDDEARIWSMIVDEGRKLREPIIAERERRKAANRAAHAAASGRGNWKYDPASKRKVADSVVEIPVPVKRFLIARASGLSFREAAESSKARWIDVLEAKRGSEEVRCAIATMEEGCRELIRMKSMSIVETGLDEGSRVSMTKVMLAQGMLKSLDRDHFGDDRSSGGAKDDEPKELGNGGFVVKLVADASKVADVAPEGKPKKALVFTDV